ncbi:MAG TPA: SurA N-terminal domain-containing protein, partial [Thermodesulfobacteriota bacterium]|nr:SurA N-terminal domain-containing protein [Thermodesulfobacteriota bacterium]
MVLSILRKKARSFFVYVAFGIIIIVFVFYFGWGSGGGDNNETWAAKVNDVSISQQRYLSYYKQMESYYRELYKQPLDSAVLEKLGLKQKALDTLIEDALMLQAAEAAGIKISQDEMQEKIQEIKAFQTEGTFDLQRYKQLLRANELSPQEFEENQVRDIMVDRIQSILEGAAKASEGELWEQYIIENEKVKLEYVAFDTAQTVDTTELTEA